MKDEILDILHASRKSEPIYTLVSRYEKIVETREKDIFLSILKEIALNGSVSERFDCLAVIQMIKKVFECEDIIKINIERINLKEEEQLISLYLSLSANLSRDWSIGFIKNIISIYKPVDKERNSIFCLALSCMSRTQFWKDSLEEILFALENFDEVFVVDFIAYFRLRQGKVGEEELLKLIPDESLIRKINDFKTKIDDRYMLNYAGMVGK